MEPHSFLQVVLGCSETFKPLDTSSPGSRSPRVNLTDTMVFARYTSPVLQTDREAQLGLHGGPTTYDKTYDSISF